jgi:hypothetical protein
MVVVSTPVMHEKRARKVTTALPSYGITHTDTALIRVYDDAGKVIETHNTGAISENGERRFARRIASVSCIRPRTL